MTRLNETHPIDIAAVELDARRLRAETMAAGLKGLKRWVASPFTPAR